MTHPAADPTFTPFIYHCRRQHSEDPLVIHGRGQDEAYCLWRLHHGSMLVVTSTDDFLLRDSGVAIAAPGHQLHLSPGSRVSLVVFDLTDRPHHVLRLQGDRFAIRIPEGCPPQPAWRDLLGFPVPVIVDPRWRARAESLIDRLRAGYWLGAIDHEYANTDLHAWLVDYLDFIATDLPGPRIAAGRLVRRAELILRQRMSEAPTAVAVATTLGLSAAQLTRHFREHRGYGSNEARDRLRMKVARLLLAEGDLDLAALASRLGFRSVPSFTAAFRQQAGCTPSDFRSTARRRQRF
jgi:AraC-like DNA-binding protein